MIKRAAPAVFILAIFLSFAWGCSGTNETTGESKAASIASVTKSTVTSSAGETLLTSTADSSEAEKAEVEKIGYIKSFEAKTDLVTFDPIEWVTKDDEARIQELGLNYADDFPNGFYIYNPNGKTESLKLSPNIEFGVVYWSGTQVEGGYMQVNRDEFIQRLNQADSEASPWRLTVRNGSIIKVDEQYVP